jgi:predicted NACHT family NTPase
MKRLIEWVMENPSSRIPILVALIGLSGVILGSLFTVVIWPMFKNMLESLWLSIKGKFSKHSFEQRYLEWVVSEHQFLPILPTTLVPVTGTKVQELDKLYVSLSISERTDDKEGMSLGKGLVNNSKLIILGDPGAGKTTMLRFLALTFAHARRKKSSFRNTAERLRDDFKIHEARRRVKEEFGFKTFPLPIFVYLNRLRDVVTWAPERSLLDALRDEWKTVDSLGDFPENFFEEKLSSGECIFLLDAFDELGTQDAREAIARHIGKLASAVPQGNRFIVSSRVVGYKGQLSKYGFNVLIVQRLSWDLISALVHKWYDTLNDAALADQLLITLKNNPRIHELAVNPMLLSLVVLVQYVRRLIPDRRHVLYEECIKILVERRYAPPDVQEEYNRILPGDEAARLIQEIAKAFHTNHFREIPRNRLEEIYIPEALTRMPESIALTVSPPALLSNIEQRSQLLVERGLNENGEPVMAFSHLTFQEYLTSVFLKDSIAQRREGVVSREIIDKYREDPEWWEEVALLYAAQLDNIQRQQFLIQLYPQQ